MEKQVVESNRTYWDAYADQWFGTTALPEWGVKCNRKISTYINVLAQAGFAVERMVEQTDRRTMEETENLTDKTRKAQMLPISMCFRARKL